VAKKDKLPKRIFVKIVREQGSGDPYFIADDSEQGMVEIGESLIVGEYELKGEHRVEGIVKSEPIKGKKQ
jgi:hypothetical protein